MKNCKTSDRQIAKKLGASQPTVTRTRSKLEQQKIILGYKAIPDLSKIGFEIIAFDVMNTRKVNYNELMLDKRVIYAVKGLGEAGDVFAVSVHKNYTDYANFAHTHSVVTGFLVLASEKPIKQFNLDVNVPK